MSACATPERDPETPGVRRANETTTDAGSPAAIPSNVAVEEAARGFVHDLIEGNVDGLARRVAYPLSFRKEEARCPDASSEVELADWATCFVQRIPQSLRDPKHLQTLGVYVYPRKPELPEYERAFFPDARDDDVFASATYRAHGFSLMLLLAFRRQPSLAVTTVMTELIHED